MNRLWRLARKFTRTTRFEPNLPWCSYIRLQFRILSEFSYGAIRKINSCSKWPNKPLWSCSLRFAQPAKLCNILQKRRTKETRRQETLIPSYYRTMTTAIYRWHYDNRDRRWSHWAMNPYFLKREDRQSKRVHVFRQTANRDQSYPFFSCNNIKNI